MMKTPALFGIATLVAGALVAASPAQSGAAGPAASGVSTYVTTQGTLAHQYEACGAQITTITPLPGHGPLTAEQLGMPAAADSMLSEIVQNGYTWIPSVTCVSKPQHTTPPSSLTATTHYSANWSGYEAPVTSPNFVHAHWTVPAAGGFPNFEAYSSIWPGIGSGSSSNKLIQAGTEQDVLCIMLGGNCQAYSRPVYFWYEVYPDENQQEINLGVASGDAVAVAASWSAGQAVFALCNDTTGLCWNGSQASTAPTSDAEWIVERTTEGGALPPLADYETATMSSDSYSTGTTRYPPSSGDAYPIDMEDCSETLSSVGPLTDSGSAFEATWHNYC